MVTDHCVDTVCIYTVLSPYGTYMYINYDTRKQQMKQLKHVYNQERN